MRERYGIEPEQVPDFIALRGDPSDGIPGAKGIGEKTARDLLREYGDARRAIEATPMRADARACAPRCTTRPTSCATSATWRRCSRCPSSGPQDRPTDFAAAAGAAEGLGMRRLAERLRGLTQ